MKTLMKSSKSIGLWLWLFNYEPDNMYFNKNIENIKPADTCNYYAGILKGILTIILSLYIIPILMIFNRTFNIKRAITIDKFGLIVGNTIIMSLHLCFTYIFSIILYEDIIFNFNTIFLAPMLFIITIFCITWFTIKLTIIIENKIDSYYMLKQENESKKENRFNKWLYNIKSKLKVKYCSKIEWYE